MGEMYVTVGVWLRSENPDQQAKALRAFFDDMTAVEEPHSRGDRGYHDPKGWWAKVKKDHPLAFAFLNWRFDGKAEEVHPDELCVPMAWAGYTRRRQFYRRGYEWFYSTECWHWAEFDFLKCYIRMHFKDTSVTIHEDQTFAEVMKERRKRIAARKKEEAAERQAANA